MSKENEKKLDKKKGFCPSSEVPALRWFQSVGAGKKAGSWSWLYKEIT